MRNVFGIRKMNSRRKDIRAVSEALGTILMLAITTFLVGSVAIWATTIGGPEEEVQVDLSAGMDYDSVYDDDTYFITHQGGEELSERVVTIHLRYAPSTNPDQFFEILGSPFKIGDSFNQVGVGVGTNGVWETGETWSMNSTTAYSRTGTVKLQVIYAKSGFESVIMEAEFDQGVTTNKMPDLVIRSVDVVDGSPADSYFIVDEAPWINMRVGNDGDPGEDVPSGDIQLTIFDGDRFLGTPTYVSGDTGSAGIMSPGETWTFRLNTSDAAHSSYDSAKDWLIDGGWSYTGRHTVFAKITPLAQEKKYSNNYESVFADVSLEFHGDLPSGPDPEVHESFVAVSNTNPKTGETVTITVFIKNKGDAALLGTTDGNMDNSCWFVISTEPIVRSGTSRNIFSWVGDSDDDDDEMTETEPTCVVKNVSIPSAGQVQYTFSWVASADYPGQVRNIYFAVDANHQNSTASPGTRQEFVTFAEGDDQDNNYGWVPVQVMPKVMVVDDDGVETGNEDDVASRVLEGLVGTGISVDGLVKATADFPKYNEEGMEPFDIIIWVTGRQTDPFTTSNIDELKLAMDDGKYVWIIGNKVLDNLYTTVPANPSPNLLSGVAPTVYTINPLTSTFDDFAYNYLGINSFSTGVNPITDQYMTILDQGLLPFPLSNWMDGKTNYTTDYTGSDTMEVIHTRVSPPYADSREISMVVQPSDSSGGPYYNSIGVKVPDGFRAVYTGFDFASLRSLNEEINITHTVMTWFNWQMNIGEDLAITDLRIEPSNPKFMETVNITVVARNNGINLKINSIMFYVTGEDGIERQIPSYAGDTNPMEVHLEGGGQVTISKEWLATETGLHTFRAMIDPYYILPEVSETNNDLSYSTSTSTSSFIRQSILVVDDDGGTSSTNMITNSIDALGYYNDVWDAGASIPTVDDLKLYNTVIWNTGGSAGHILDGSVGGTQEQIMDYLLGNYEEAKYLDKHNETLWLLGNGFISGSGTYTSGNFFHDIFGVGYHDDNFISSSANLVGKTDNEISHGIVYERTGFGIADDRINKASTLSLYDTAEEVYFGTTQTSPNCIGIAKNNSFYYYNTIISTYNLNDIIIPGLVPDKDTQIELPTGSGYGGMDKLKLGRVTDADQRAVMMEWDLSDIPSTATIDSATLKFYTTGMVGATAISRVNVYPVNDNALAGAGMEWIEGPHSGEAATQGASWTHYDVSLMPGGAYTGNTVRLPGAGAGLEATRKTSTPNLPTASQAVSIDVRPIVQDWVDGTLKNEGLALTLWSEILAEQATGENEIYSKEYMSNKYWPRLIVSYTDGGVSGQSPVGKENAVAEMGYLGLHWLALRESRPDFRATYIDISVNDANPQLGNSYIISADIANRGDGAGACTVRFLDGDTLVKTSTIYLEGGEEITEEAIWVPLYAGSGDPAYFRTLTVSLDPLDKVEEVFDTFNNQPDMSAPVYFLYDDFEYDNQAEAELNWDHEATVVNINGESTLDFLENAETNIISEFSGYSFSDEEWVRNYVVSHSVNSSFSIREPTTVGTINTALDIVLVLDRSGSMQGTKTQQMKDACNTLVDLLDQNDRVAAFGFDSTNDWLWDFVSCDSTGKATLHSYINGLTNLPSGSTGLYTSVARDASTLGTFNGNLDGEDGVQDDGALWFMKDNARAGADRSIIALSDGASWDYAMYPTCINAVWNAGGKVNYIDSWNPHGAAVPRTDYPAAKVLKDGTTPMNLKVYSIGLEIAHDPLGTPNPIQQQPRTTYRDERKMWRMSQESYVSTPGWTDNAPANGFYDTGEMGGFGYFYAPTSNELEDIFKQIATAMGGAGTTRWAAPEASRASRAVTTLYADYDRTAGNPGVPAFYGYSNPRVGLTGTLPLRSAVRWPTWSIPDGSRIDGATMRFYVANDLVNNADLDIYEFDYNPTTGTAASFWTETRTDNQYVQDSGLFANTGWQSFTPAASTGLHADIEASLALNWFAVGLSEQDDNSGADCWVYGNGATLPAQLVVTYTADDIYENNDIFSTAYDLGTISGTNYYTCQMFDSNDFYEINSVNIGDKIVVNLDFVDALGDIDLRLYGPDMSTIVASSTTVTDDEGISYTAAYSGTYYIRVYPKVGSFKNSYDMTVIYGLGAGGILQYPKNPYPALGSTEVPLHPILIWTGGDAGYVDHYGIWMGNEEGLETRIPDPDTGAGLKLYGDSYDPGVLVPLKTYFWYVVAYDADNELIANKMDSRNYLTGSPPAAVGSWAFTVESSGSPSMGDPANDELNPLDTKAFRLTDAATSKLTFFHKFNIEPTVNGAYLQLGVKYKGGATTADIENPDNYRYYYIIPEETYNSNLYLGTDSYPRPYLACEGADFHVEAPVNYGQDYNGDGDHIDPEENLTMWCWNGKSSGGLFDWQYASVDLIDQIEMINSQSSAGIDIDADYFKVRFSYFYYGAGNGGGWWIDDVKVTSSTSGTPAVTSQDVWQFVKHPGRANSGDGCWWNGNPANAKLMHAGIDNSLITKPIDLTRAVEANFDAYFAYNINTDPGLPPDCLRIEISSDGGNTWKAINYGVRSFAGVSSPGANPSASYKAASTESRINVNLAAWSGEVVLLRFRVVTTNDIAYAHSENSGLAWGGLYLDDITISGTSITEARSTPVGSGERAPRSLSKDPLAGLVQWQAPVEMYGLEEALVNARVQLAEQNPDASAAFDLMIPLGAGFEAINVEDDGLEEPVEPAEAQKEIYDFLAVVLATRREAEVPRD